MCGLAKILLFHQTEIIAMYMEKENRNKFWDLCTGDQGSPSW